MVRRKILTVKGEKEEASVELSWYAVFSDSSTKNGFLNGSYSSNFRTVESRQNVVEFGLTPISGDPVVLFDVTGDATFFYRMRVSMLPFSEYTFPHSRRIYLVGYHTSDGKTRFWVVDTNGDISQRNKFDKHANFTEPDWRLPGEQV